MYNKIFTVDKFHEQKLAHNKVYKQKSTHKNFDEQNRFPVVKKINT